MLKRKNKQTRNTIFLYMHYQVKISPGNSWIMPGADPSPGVQEVNLALLGGALFCRDKFHGKEERRK